MREYEFTLKYKLPDYNIDPEIYIDRLYESGCDDALIGIGKIGSIGFNFIRKSDSAYEAIASAIRDIKKVIPQANLIEVSPDLVGMTDVANLLGCTRQNIQKLMSKEDLNCPSAVYEGAQSIWHLTDILTWLVESKNYSIDESLREIAIATKNLNLIRQSIKIDRKMQENFQTLITLQ